MLPRLGRARSCRVSGRHVHDHQTSPGTQRALDTAKHGFVLGHLVVRIYDEHGIHRLVRQRGIVRLVEDGRHVLDRRIAQGLVDLPQHRLIDVDCIYPAARSNNTAQPKCEEPRARANISDVVALLDVHRGEDLIDPLPLVARCALDLGARRVSEERTRGSEHRRICPCPSSPACYRSVEACCQSAYRQVDPPPVPAALQSNRQVHNRGLGGPLIARWADPSRKRGAHEEASTPLPQPHDLPVEPPRRIDLHAEKGERRDRYVDDLRWRRQRAPCRRRPAREVEDRRFLE